MMSYWDGFKILIGTIVLFVGMTATAVVADDTQGSTITKGRTDSGYIRLRSTTDSRGITRTRGYVDGRYIRFTTKPQPTTSAYSKRPPVYVGRKTLSEKVPPKDY